MMKSLLLPLFAGVLGALPMALSAADMAESVKQTPAFSSKLEIVVSL